MFLEQENQNYVILSRFALKPWRLDKWSAYEIAVFEAALSVFGKHFEKISKIVPLVLSFHCRLRQRPRRKWLRFIRFGIFQVTIVCGRISGINPSLFVSHSTELVCRNELHFLWRFVANKNCQTFSNNRGMGRREESNAALWVVLYPLKWELMDCWD